MTRNTLLIVSGAAALAAFARPAVASPAHLASVQVTFTRTITSTEDTKGTGDCPKTETQSSKMVEKLTFGSDAYPISDDGDELELRTVKKLPAHAHALVGSGIFQNTFAYHAATPGKQCDWWDDKKESVSAAADLGKLFIDLDYTRSSKQGSLQVTPAFAKIAAQGQEKSHFPPQPDSTEDTSKQVRNAAKLGMLTSGQLQLDTAAEYKAMGIKPEKQPSLELQGEDKPMVVAVTPTGISVSYDVTDVVPAEQVDPPTEGAKRTGMYTVTTHVTVFVSTAKVGVRLTH